MQQVKFYLRDPKDAKSTNIIMLWSFDGKRLKYSTGEKVRPMDWNQTNQRVKRTVTGCLEINSLLDKLTDDLKRIYRVSSLNNEKISIELLKKRLDEEFKGKLNDSDLYSFIDEFIISVKGLRSKATVNIYKNTKNLLKSYESFSHTKINFDSIHLDFYNDFTTYMIKEKSFGINTIAKAIKTLKTFLNEATERGLNKKMDFKSRRFKVVTEETESIYLSENEIQKIYDLNLEHDQRLKRVRDLFIVGCNTGLRFSDLCQLKAEHINGNLIRIRTQKTNELVVVPISNLVKCILVKNNGLLPVSISNQKTNEYLKEIGEKAKLNDTIELMQSQGQKKVKVFRKKYELITTHTARRSFATNLYLQGFPTISIMKITGHRTEKAFMRYLKISQEQNAELLNKFWNDKFNLKIA